jgi:hypothetical protein
LAKVKKRNVDYSQSVVHEKKKRQWDKEELMLAELLKEASKPKVTQS